MIRGVIHPLEILFGGGVGLSCSTSGELSAEALHGLFAGDTRVLSTYRFAIAGHSWRLLSRARSGPSTARWDMQNPMVRTPGGDLKEGSVHFRIGRRVDGALHDDLTLTSFCTHVIPVRFSVQLDADFADLFQVKEGSTPPRLGVERVPAPNALRLAYTRRDFRRALHVKFEPTFGQADFVGAQAVFDLWLEPKASWNCCVELVPELDGRRLEFRGDPHGPDPAPGAAHELTLDAAPVLEEPFEQGCVDLERLAMKDDSGAEYIAAGAPWFLSLFGRDTLVTSLMAGVLGPWHARGALASLAATQARARDDYRDAEPGKLAHELRHGELARFRDIPHTPYYGTHDAPALYVLALWNTFRWTGDRSLVERYLPQAEAALRWCEELGDQDGDGLLEYRTRSTRGYRHQSWKDAEDGILHQDGAEPPLPIATVELQGYWYAALRAMSELLELVGAKERAAAQRAAARELRRRVEERFWLEDAGIYAMALDGDKRLVQSVGSNAGHLLWCGLPSRERAAAVARRLLEPDMFSGYGVRTLSSAHPSYNPLSYQLGSVWPHDNALLVAGFLRYDLHDAAARVARGVLDAAVTFEQCRLPELYCGFERDDGAPVPYEKANVPQAWAAATPLLLAQVFLGLSPDVPNGRCDVAPWLPDWLPELTLRGIELGEGRLDIRIARHGEETHLEYARHPTLEVIARSSAAPLWGEPYGADE